MPHQAADENLSNNFASGRDWNKFDAILKRYAIIGIIGISLAIALLFGPQALYLVIGIGAVAAFAIYPEIDPEWVLWGGTIGALCAGPLAIIPGSMLGYYVGQKYNQFVSKMETLNTAVNTVKSGFDTVKSTPSNLKSKFKNMLGRISSAFGSTPDANPAVIEPASLKETLPTPTLELPPPKPIITKAVVSENEAPLRQKRKSKQFPILLRKASEKPLKPIHQEISSTPRVLLLSKKQPQIHLSLIEKKLDNQYSTTTRHTIRH